MSSLTEDLQEIVSAAGLPAGVHACAYRTVQDPEFDTFVELVLILKAQEWTDEAVAICEEASMKLNDAARGTGHAMSFFCRTSGEHETAADDEAGIWTPVDISVPC